MSKKRIREKRARKHGYCPRCGSHNTISMRDWREVGRREKRWVSSGYYNVVCFRCGYGLDDDGFREYRELVARERYTPRRRDHLAEMKPCPRCGSDNAQSFGTGSALGWFARCDECGFGVEDRTADSTLSRWQES